MTILTNRKFAFLSMYAICLLSASSSMAAGQTSGVKTSSSGLSTAEGSGLGNTGNLLFFNGDYGIYGHPATQCLVYAFIYQSDNKKSNADAEAAALAEANVPCPSAYRCISLADSIEPLKEAVGCEQNVDVAP